ncbi:MAG: phosphoribosylformylglycinamidine cyclo-ligase [Gemmatimonadetes bacterium]|nr:phosphoribosylformylglycinamidine cyclo-ligase [Gemmatimonadota bacterium]MYB61869.1 phosphoribosylformylglycinamidine cyclo-ligase [Gemmatimonadota bacterium]
MADENPNGSRASAGSGTPCGSPAGDHLTYEDAGVDYDRIDPLKVLAQQAARATGANLERAGAHTGVREVTASRGESAYVVDIGDAYLASITECLGTKALVADAMRKVPAGSGSPGPPAMSGEPGRTWYNHIAQDTIATAVNDLVTVGARPLSIHAYWAAGSSEWFDDTERMNDLVDGWKAACDVLGVAWGGGETPCLTGVVEEGAIDLAASCVGIIRPKSRLTLGEDLAAGDAIVLLESSGIHANGLTLARKLSERLPEGYATAMPGGRTYGEALLDPTVLYPPVTEAAFEAGIGLRYIANITGHGWRKIMRHPGRFTYRISEVPPVPEVLRFMVDKTRQTVEEAYGSLNMGAGFALFVRPEDGDAAVACAEARGIRAWNAGVVEDGPRQVVIEPLGVTLSGESLALRD